MQAHAVSIDALNRRRHALAGLATLSAFGMLVALGRPILPAQAPQPVQAAMELVLEQLQAPLEPPPPPAAAAQRQESPRQQPAAATPPALTAPAPETPVTAVAAPAPAVPSVPAAQAAHPLPTAEVKTAQPAETPRTVPAPTSPHVSAIASAEAGFVAQLRALLNAAKRYPTGREASLQRPAGKVTVWFVLSRSGQLGDVGIEDSSNSILLDNAALSTLRRASFPPLPEAAWPGAPTHRFTVTLDFVAPG